MSDVLRGSIIMFVSFFGVIFNWTVLIFIKRMPSFNQSFGTLTRNQAFGDALHATTEFFLVAPMIIFDITLLKSNSNFMSFLLLFGYDLSVLTHLLLSLNRCCAVFHPVKYHTLFNANASFTTYVVIGTDIYCLITTSMLYISGCHYYWSDSEFSFLYHAFNQCETLSFYAVFCKYIALVFTVVAIDLATMAKARSFYNKLSEDNGGASKRKRTNEMFFLIQTCLQGMLFGCELVCYFLVSPLVQDRMIRFFLTAFAFSLIHSTDGALSILCNQEFRAFVLRRNRPKVGMSAVSGPVTASAKNSVKI